MYPTADGDRNSYSGKQIPEQNATKAEFLNQSQGRGRRMGDQTKPETQ